MLACRASRLAIGHFLRRSPTNGTVPSIGKIAAGGDFVATLAIRRVVVIPARAVAVALDPSQKVLANTPASFLTGADA